MELGRLEYYRESSGGLEIKYLAFFTTVVENGSLAWEYLHPSYWHSKNKFISKKYPVLQDSYTRNPDTLPIKWLQVCKLVYATTHLLDLQKLKDWMLFYISEDVVEL